MSNKNLEGQVKKKFSVSQAGKRIGVHPNTLRNWERKGLIKVQRDRVGNRIFSKEEIEKIKNFLQ